jgi:hypothetical protein
MNNEKEYAKLKEKLKQLSAKRYKRFNVLILNDIFAKLEQEAEKTGKSKAKMLSEMISSYSNKCYIEHKRGKYGGCSIPHYHD